MACRVSLASVLRVGWTCALVMGLALSAKATWIDRPYASVQLFGSMQRVNAGQVSPWDYQVTDLSSFVGALGTATAGKSINTGDFLSFAGRTFLRMPDPKKGVQVVEVTKPMKTAFLFGIGNPSVDNAKIFPRPFRQRSTEPELLHSMLEKLANEVSAPVGVLGWMEMPSVDGIALKKAPIDDQPINGEQRATYQDTIRTENAHVVFFAVVMPVPQRPSFDVTVLSRMVFDATNEQGQPATALIHVHGALVNEAAPADFTSTPGLLEDLRKVTVKDILHIHGTSAVSRGLALVYQLETLEPAKARPSDAKPQAE